MKKDINTSECVVQALAVLTTSNRCDSLVMTGVEWIALSGDQATHLPTSFADFFGTNVDICDVHISVRCASRNLTVNKPLEWFPIKSETIKSRHAGSATTIKTPTLGNAQLEILSRLCYSSLRVPVVRVILRTLFFVLPSCHIPVISWHSSCVPVSQRHRVAYFLCGGTL